MAINTVLFDLDGTLLPMDQDEFVKAYFGALAKKLSGHGYEPEKLIATVWQGTKAMVQNDGSCTNEEAFWKVFTACYGEGSREDIPVFDAFYRGEFQKVQQVCGFAPESAEIIRFLKERGVQVILATNPIFPAVATQSRIRWAGLEPEDFSHITTYENSRFCKPNLAYYQQICEELSIAPSQCLMVGNDVEEDMVTQQLGMDTFLLMPCLLNRKDLDISRFRRGDFSDLAAYLRSIFSFSASKH